MAPKSVTFRRHDHLVSVLFGDLLSHSYNITFQCFCILWSIHLYRYRYMQSSKLFLTFHTHQSLMNNTYSLSCRHEKEFKVGRSLKTTLYKIQEHFQNVMLVGMVSKISKTTHTSVWIAQDTTESRVPRQNMHTN